MTRAGCGITIAGPKAFLNLMEEKGEGALCG